MGYRLQQAYCSAYQSYARAAAANTAATKADRIIDARSAAAKGKTVEQAESSIRRALKEVADKGILESELKRIKVRILSDQIYKRDSIFGADLFEDPAWNIMLDLYSSTLHGRTVTVSDLCVASGTSATTALRRLGTLVDLGLIKRIADVSDRRRVLVVQTELGRQAMDQFAEWLRDSISI